MMNNEQTATDTVILWTESVQGIANGHVVHMGQQAVFYPDKNCAVIRVWDPRSETTERIPVPKGMQDKNTVISYLSGKCHVPLDVLCELQRETGAYKPTEPSLILPDGSAVSAGGKHMVGFQLTATGYFGYDFYFEQQEICSVSSQSFPGKSFVNMSGMGKTWKSEFDTETTLVPGWTTRIVQDDATQGDALHIKYMGAGKYKLLFDANEVFACADPMGYRFIAENRQIARMQRIEKSPWRPEERYYDIAPWFLVELQEDISTDVILAILSFPSLKFGL